MMLKSTVRRRRGTRPELRVEGLTPPWTLVVLLAITAACGNGEPSDAEATAADAGTDTTSSMDVFADGGRPVDARCWAYTGMPDECEAVQGCGAVTDAAQWKFVGDVCEKELFDACLPIESVGNNDVHSAFYRLPTFPGEEPPTNFVIMLSARPSMNSDYWGECQEEATAEAKEPEGCRCFREWNF